MSQQDMDRDSLRQKIAARLGWTPNPERSVSWHEAVEAALDVVAPHLAEKDAEIRDLDARRARWALEHERRRDELEAVEASRRDWAAEAARLQETATADPWGCDRCMDAGPEEPLCDADRRPFTFCSCLTAEGAAVVLAGRFSLPLCAVHPEADR